MFLGECKVERWEDTPKDGNEEDQGQACPEYRGLAGGGVGSGKGTRDQEGDFANMEKKMTG